MIFLSDADWVRIAPDIAKKLFGEPTKTTSHELRWGRHGSKSLNLLTGQWYDHEEGIGGGVVDLLKHYDLDTRQVLKQFGYDKASPESNMIPLTPTSGGAKSYTKAEMQRLLEESILALKYSDNFVVMRFNATHRIKAKGAPFSKNADGTWSNKRPAGLMPIYYQAKRLDLPVIINEGEKACKGCAKIYEGDAVTWHGGTNGWSKCDWSPIYGKEVYIFPDNDEAGKKCALEIQKHLKSNGCKVTVANPPKDFAEKDDLWDAYEKGYFATSDDLVNYIKNNPIKKPRGSLYVQTVNEIMSNITEPDWVIDRIAESGTVLSVFGEPKSGKSFITIAMSCAVATGTDFYDYKTKKSAVIYLAGEGFTGIARRCKSYETFFDVKLSDAPLLITNRGSRIGDDDEFAMLQDLCRDVKEEHGQIGMIVIDTLARNYGLNENSTEDMNLFIQRVDELKEEFGATMVIVHHTGHVSSGRARGSSVLPAALDYEFQVKRDKSSDPKAMLVQLEQKLVKDGTPIDSMNLKFKEIEMIGFENVTSGVLAPTEELFKVMTKKDSKMYETLEIIESLQEKADKDNPDSVHLTHTEICAAHDIGKSAVTGRLNQLIENELITKCDLGYQSKKWNENEPY